MKQKLVIVGTVGGAVFRIQCGSAGWGSATVKTLTSPRRGYLSDVIAIDALGKRLWMTCSHTGGGHVYFSSDGGQTWENRTGNLPETAVNALAIDPGNSQRIFAGTDHGVFESADAGLNWRTFSNGLPNAIVGDLIVHTTSRLLRAGTRSRGAWELSI